MGRLLCYYCLLLVSVTVYGGQVCPFVAALPVLQFAGVVGVHLVLALVLRPVLLAMLLRSLPAPRQANRLFAIDYFLLVTAGFGVACFNTLVFRFPWLSGIEIVVGFATVALIPSLDLSLAWEYQIIRQQVQTQPHDVEEHFFSPQTRRFALIACGVIVFVTLVLLALLWRDFSLFTSSRQHPAELFMMLRNIMYEILLVMAMVLGLSLVVIFSYARNLRLLFAYQTNVLEMVSQGILEHKVPVVTNDEFALIARHTNTMIDRLVERQKMSRGLELARQIQTNLLPRSSPFLRGVQVFGESRFSDETGGDFFDYFVREQAGGHELVLVVGDVTGHGVGPALLMASVRAYLKAQLQLIDDLSTVMEKTNRLISHDLAGSGFFTTVFLYAYQPEQRQARWVSAGHDPAIFLPLGGTLCQELFGQDIPLGIEASWKYTMTMAEQGPGLLLLGTDGIWEALDSSLDMFGKARLQQLLLGHSHAAPQEIIGKLFEELDYFTAKAALSDDQTAVVARLA